MRRGYLSAITGLLVLLLVAPAIGHEGHDHDSPPPLNLPVAPRVVAVTPELELVGVTSGKDRLTIFLHAFATNEPVAGARMTVSAGDVSAEAQAEGAGVFSVSAPWLATPNDLDLIFALTLADGTQDLLTGQLAGMAMSQPVATSVQNTGPWWFLDRVRQQPELGIYVAGGLMSGILLTLLMVGTMARRKSRDGHDKLVQAVASAPTEVRAASADIAPLRRGVGVLIAAPLAVVALAATANAVDTKGAAPPALPSTMATDLPQRMPDGTLFVPKASQHLLSIRTIVTAPGKAARSVELTGTIVAAPGHFGRVQSGRPGRISATPNGLAYIGKPVEKGDVLAYLQPYIEAADRANLDSQLAETEGRIEKNRTILAHYEKVPGAMPRVKVDEVRGELDALTRKRTELLQSVAPREAVVAPIGGIVSLANATVGQIVDARDVLFEIIDPSQFWVEAHGYGSEARVLRNLSAAHAVLPDGRTMPIELAGRGLILRQQATVVTFKVMGGRNSVSVGTPVKVVLQSKTQVEGYVVPASAVVRGQTGLPIVWIKVEAERFEPQLVKIAPLDGQSVLVASGLKDDQRVVTSGATLLNQIR